MKLAFKSFINYVFVVVFFLLAFFINSCTHDDTIDPAQYEKYISISSDQTPAVSPDGEWIAYYHLCLESNEPQDYQTGLYIVDKNGSNHRLLLKGTNFEPSWSPDGEWIVFSSYGVLEIINFSGDSIRVFEGIDNLPLYRPDWSFDGQSILFSAPLTTSGGVFSMTPDFKEIIRILNPIENNGMYATYSPDDKKIVYEKGNQSLSSVEIFTLDLSSMLETRLTYDDNVDRDATWSPANEFIAWTSNFQISRMDTDGSNHKRIDYGQYPSWTPDGEYIIYSNANHDFTKEVLWKIDKNGNNKTQLTF